MPVIIAWLLGAPLLVVIIHCPSALRSRHRTIGPHPPGAGPMVFRIGRLRGEAAARRRKITAAQAVVTVHRT